MTIVSATLTMHQFGNAGQGTDSGAPTSLIQISTVAEDWLEEEIHWNNAPLAGPNVSRASVDPLPKDVTSANLARHWDIGLAMANAYTNAEPLRLVLYSPDTNYHSGKYFWSSDAKANVRPSLDVVWGNPVNNQPENRLPQALDDSASTQQNTAVTIDVLKMISIWMAIHSESPLSVRRNMERPFSKVRRYSIHQTAILLARIRFPMQFQTIYR